MSQNIQALSDFINRAVKSRKYPESTAQGYRAALKLFEAEANDEESDSLETFKKNLDQIYHSVSSKNGRDYTANSLAAYKSRILKIIGDYEKYGIDPTKMAGWSPKIIIRGPRKPAQPSGSSSEDANAEDGNTQVVSGGMHKIELALRDDKKFIVIVPRDITSQEAVTLKAVLDSLVIKSD